MYKALLILGVVLAIAIIPSIWAIRYFTAGVRGEIGKVEQIQSAGSKIANYNYFFDLCASIQGHEAALDAMKEQFDNVGDEEERYRILANIAGIQSQRLRSIYQYNVDARKDYTIAEFRDSDLPYQLEDNEYRKGERTSCGSR